MSSWQLTVSRASPASLAVWCQSSTISAHTGDVIEVATSTLCGTVEARAFLSQFPIFSARTHTTRYPPPSRAAPSMAAFAVLYYGATQCGKRCFLFFYGHHYVRVPPCVLLL